MYPLVNEGAKILEEGIAIRASDVDIVYLFGYGFPVYRGGPMFWAEQIGLDKVLATIRGFHKIHGKFWEPAKLLVQRAEAGRSEEHTSELQSLMRISYAVFCLKKKKTNKTQTSTYQSTTQMESKKH